MSAHLVWTRREGAEAQSEEFARGHANALLGRATSSEHELVIGLSLMAPDVAYPDHHHPPEELYVVLSPGTWRQDRDEWHEPGVGGVVHNPPDVVHSMRAGDSPLLALWLQLLQR